jgi:proline racemase
VNCRGSFIMSGMDVAKLPGGWAQAVETVDYHTAGEPFRIVTAGVPPVPGANVLERRDYAQRHLDACRRLLVFEPRGHADMYGCFVVPPDDDGALLGTLFFHNAGFSTACGHGTIALATWAADTGLVRPDGAAETAVAIDVPSGRVQARIRWDDGRADAVVFRNVPSFVLERGARVGTGAGEVGVDIAFGGAYYASVEASEVGLAVRPGNVTALIALGREIKQRLNDRRAAEHPDEPRLSGIYGVTFTETVASAPDGLHQRSLTVFADGEVDRSPCGSGTSARLALLDASGDLAPGAPLRHESVIGTVFTARVAERVTAHGRPAVITEVEGRAFRTGEHRFVLDPRDELGPGFLL